MVVRGFDFDRDEDGNLIHRCNGGISDIRDNYGPSPLGNTAPRGSNSGEEIGQANSDQIAHDQRINIQSSPSNAINPYYQDFHRLLESGQIRTPVISTVDNNLDIRTNTLMDRLESLGIRQNSLGQEERDRNVELSQTSYSSRIDRAIDNLYRQAEAEDNMGVGMAEPLFGQHLINSSIGNINPNKRLRIDGEFLHRHTGFEKILKRDGHVVIDEEDWKRARELLSDSNILKIEDVYGGRE